MNGGNRFNLLPALMCSGVVMAASVAIAMPASAASNTYSNDSSYYPAISADGRYIAFESYATNLVAKDTNHAMDVFLRDTVTGTTSRISVTSTAGQANDHSSSAAISADGRYVAFASRAANLVPGDTNGMTDVFLRDTVAGTTTQVSVATDGTPGNSLAEDPAISADGRYVTFSSYSSNLVTGDTNGITDIFVRDTVAGTTTRISVATDGSQALAGSPPVTSDDEEYIPEGSYFPAISGDGRYLTFASYAANLVAGDTNGVMDVFVRDTVAGITSRISVAGDGTQANNVSDQSSLSYDGRYIAFGSLASNLVAGDTNGVQDVFVRDLATGALSRSSVSSTGAEGDGRSDRPVLSANGQRIAFDSTAGNLAAGFTQHNRDVYLRDASSATTALLSVTAAGAQATVPSFCPTISANGRYIAFWSYATDLVSGGSGTAISIFVRDTITGTTNLVSVAK